MFERLIVLGGGGWFPAHGRHTACALLRNGSAAVMIDAGTGVGRLVERPELLHGVERLDIVLTHFHLDHVAGLAYLPALNLTCETTVWGPGATLYGTTTEALIDPLYSEPFHPVTFGRQRIAIRDLPAGEVELGGTRVHTRRQDRHSAPTLGLRFEDELAWITDTAFDPGRSSSPPVAGCWHTKPGPPPPSRAIRRSTARPGRLPRSPRRRGPSSWC